MTGEASVALPPRALSRERLGERLGGAAPFLVGGLVTGILAADEGGYWPTAWGWSALVLAWLGLVGLVLRAGRIGRLELAFAGLLAAFVGWTGLSVLWTSSTTQTVLTTEQAVVYVLAAVAVVGVVRAGSYHGLVWGVWAGSASACLYGLVTRLAPERFPVPDAATGGRLTEPVGYWNGLGLLAAMTVLLGLGLAAHGRPLLGRAAAAASLPLLLPTLYLTFSRGAWVVLGIALAATVALSPRRLALLVTVLVQAAPAALGVWLVERRPAMHETTATLAATTHAGHRLLWQLPVVALLAAALGAAQALIAGWWTPPVIVRRAFGGVAALAAVAGLVAVVAHYGGPAETYRHAKSSFEGVAPGGTNLNSRLFSLSSNGRLSQWHVALDEWHAHPVLGGGAGTWNQYWGAAKPNQPQVVNVHNEYLEVLAELGPFGLVLLAAALLVPLVAAVRLRHRALVPVAAGAYVAFVTHIAYDWDWQLTGVTVAALFCAGAVLAAGRQGDAPGLRSPARVGLVALALAAAVFAFVGLMGNRALARSGNEFQADHFAAAIAAANDARRWAPWSSQPWSQLAAIRVAQGDRAAAADAYRHAVAKDPRDWELWLGLASMSTGAERAHALAEANRLSPGVTGP